MSDTAPAMPQEQTARLVTTWAVLTALTLLSWWLRDHGLGADLAASTILAITFIKVFMVGHSFMEIGHSAWQLRVAFAAWCVATCCVLVVLFYTL